MHMLWKYTVVPIGKIKTRVEFNEASKCYIHVCHNSSNGRSSCDDGDLAQSPSCTI